jgi:hypothetical protein
VKYTPKKYSSIFPYKRGITKTATASVFIHSGEKQIVSKNLAAIFLPWSPDTIMKKRVIG